MAGLPRKERLFERKFISMLFSRGKRMTVGNKENSLRVCYLLLPRNPVPAGGESAESVVSVAPDVACKVMVNAPKSRFKRAVDRNRIKRLLRESFRFRKDLFVSLAPEGTVLLISLQFAGKKEIALAQMLQQVEKAGKLLQSRFSHE